MFVAMSLECQLSKELTAGWLATTLVSCLPLAAATFTVRFVIVRQTTTPKHNTMHMKLPIFVVADILIALSLLPKVAKIYLTSIALVSRLISISTLSPTKLRTCRPTLHPKRDDVSDPAARAERSAFGRRF